jgi:predicted nucleic acid-binding protein
LADHIVNTSPFCYLHGAGILHVMPAILGRVIAPAQVATELSAGRGRGYDLPDLVTLPWVDLRVVAPLSPELGAFGFLGAGERAVLTLAMANPAAVAVIDERPARKVAARFGVKVTGTLNLILVAKQLGHLQAVRPILDRLQELRFRVSVDLREHILALAGEA